MVKRFDVYWVKLDPTLGHELRKTRPAVIISSEEDIAKMSTVIILPLTSTIKILPRWIPCEFLCRPGSIVLEQIRAVDKSRLDKKMGSLDKPYQQKILDSLQEMFS